MAGWISPASSRAVGAARAPTMTWRQRSGSRRVKAGSVTFVPRSTGCAPLRARWDAMQARASSGHHAQGARAGEWSLFHARGGRRDQAGHSWHRFGPWSPSVHQIGSCTVQAVQARCLSCMPPPSFDSIRAGVARCTRGTSCCTPLTPVTHAVSASAHNNRRPRCHPTLARCPRCAAPRC